MESYLEDKRQQMEAASADSGAPPVRRLRNRRAGRRGQIGSAIIEFAVVVPFILITLFGTISFGIVLGRYVEVVQVTRDIAHMYTDGVDFTVPAAKALAVQLAQGTGMTANGGNGVVMLSRVRQIYASDCTAAGYGSCPNAGKIVFTQRVTIGNTSLRASTFGTPNAAILNSEGNIDPSVYLQNTDSTVQTTPAMAAMYTAAGQPAGLAAGDSPWIVEMYCTAPDISFLDFSYSPNLRTSTAGGAYAKFVF